MKFNRLVFTIALVVSFGLNAEGQELKARYRPELRNLSEVPITQVGVNEDFWLYVFVSDLQIPPEGVFSAFVDVTYDASLVSDVDGTIDHLNTYTQATHGAVSSGLADEVGGLGPFTPLGGGEFAVFRLLMHSGGNTGKVHFMTDPADDLIQHPTLHYFGTSELPLNEIEFLGTTLSIVPEPTSWGLLLLTSVVPITRLRSTSNRMETVRRR